MLKLVRVVCIAAVATVAISTTAMAATIIDFRTGSAAAGGAISFDGTNVIGNDVPIGLVEIFDAPLNNGVFNVTGMLANASPGSFGDLDFNTTAGNNFITIAGCIPGLGLGTFDGSGNCSAPVTLLSGTIDSFTANSAQGVFTAVGPDFKHASLLAAIGLGPNTPFELFGFTLLTGQLGATPQPSISTDIRNSAVPEPATMILLGTGLLAAFRARRRQA